MTIPVLSLSDGGVSEPAKPKFQMSDLGNAVRLITLHADRVRYVPAWKKWLLWDGKRWASDDTLEIVRLAKATVRAMWEEIPGLPAISRESRAKHALRSESDGRIRAMIELAKSEHGIAVTPASLDRDPWLLAVENGTIDLRTAQLRDHDPKDLITKVCPVQWDPEARCDTWEAFLKRVLADDQDLINFVQRAVGYSLTGSTSEQCLFFLYGNGANGKSTFLEVLRALLAGYASQTDFTTFLEKTGDGPRNDIARLIGARVVTSSEVGDGKRFNESLVKTLTGDEMITARFLHAEFFEFRPAFKLWLAANHRPTIRGTDNAIWRRIRLVPFIVAIPERERDPELRDKLLAELPGILLWAVAGCRFWRAQSLGMAAVVRDATDRYRRESDTLGAFLEDCCELGDRALYAEPAAQLYSAYRAWCVVGGEYSMTQTKFGRALEERGLPAEKRGRDRARITWRAGIRLVLDPRSLAAPPASAPAVQAGEPQEELEV